MSYIVARAMPASRILLVEDDPDVRVLMEHVLTGDGYAVDLAGTVEAARTLLRNHKYDLAVVDGVLPDGSGIVVAEVAEALGIPAIGRRRSPSGSRSVILPGSISC